MCFGSLWGTLFKIRGNNRRPHTVTSLPSKSGPVVGPLSYAPHPPVIRGPPIKEGPTFDFRGEILQKASACFWLAFP